jgi:2-polyprenyl-6-methoxyphenol hydroxylase-like FAD-dependent oxidoreductase
VVLVGDAAHQFLPLAGQGLNVGLADVAKLKGLVKQYGLEDPGKLSVVNRYRRARKEEIKSFTYFTEAMHDTVVRGSNFYRPMHNLGFWAVRHANVLKRVLIKKAVG